MESASPESQKKKKDYGECFTFHDYSGEGKGFDVVYDKEEWKIKMFDMKDVSNAIILNSTTYWLPLEMPIGDLLYRLRIGNLRVQHWLRVFECKFEDENLFYLSFEKNKNGIITQYSRNKDDVLENLPTKKRKYYKKIGTVKGGDLDFTKPLSKMMSLNKLSVKKVIENWEPELEYILLESNCQTLVYDIEEVFSKISNEEGVKFMFPGTDPDRKKEDLISLSNKYRPRINDMITTYSENCFENKIFKVSSLPRVLVSIENTEFAKSNDVRHLRYFKNEIKDKIDKLIYSSLKKKNFKGLYYSNLNKNKMEINLKDGIKNEKNLDARLCADIAAFWCREIDGVILSEKYSAIIVETIVGQKERETETDKEMPNEIMLKELIKIGTLPMREKIELPITVITIQVVEESLHYKAKRNNIIIEETSLLENFDDIKKRFHESFEHFLKQIKQKLTVSAIEQMKFLAGCLLIFENMADYENVLYRKVTNQEWQTESNLIVWSPEQKIIIDRIIRSFEDICDPDSDRKASIHLIFGCPGTGKTLILLHAVRHYCARWPTKKVLIVVPEYFNSLHEQLDSKLKDLIENEKKSVSICSRLKLDNQLNVGLIVFDEFHVEDAMDFRKLKHRKSHVIAANMGEKTIIDIMNFGHHYEVSRNYLIGVNHRSDKAIIKLINEAQKNIAMERSLLPVTAGSFSMTLSTEAVCLWYMTKGGFIKLDDKTTVEGDNTLERNDFIDRCVDYILTTLKLYSGKILIYNACHYSLLLRIKKKLEILSRKEESITLGQFRNLEFVDPLVCCGAEYVLSIGIYDHMSVPFDLHEEIIVCLTRTILYAHLLINIATTVPDCYVFDHHSSLKFKKLGPCTTYCADDNELNHVLSGLKGEGKIVRHATHGIARRDEPVKDGWHNADVLVFQNWNSNYIADIRTLSPVQGIRAMIVVLDSEKEFSFHETSKERMRDLLVNRFQKAILD